MNANTKVAILGSGNLGLAIGKGLINRKVIDSKRLYMTRKHLGNGHTSELQSQGFQLTTNKEAISHANVVLICVVPQSLNELLQEISAYLTKDHLLISCVSGAEIQDIRSRIKNNDVEVVRAMPNTAIALGESMTCIAGVTKSSKGLELTKHLFDNLGSAMIVSEEQIVPATALCACGIAFFARAIRAAGQGGIQIGFHSEDAIKLAAQTAKGAASILLSGEHPEKAIDKVTTPMGCTIAGLNQLEHNGFSSAFIKGIVTSAEKAAVLYKKKPAESVTGKRKRESDSDEQ